MGEGKKIFSRPCPVSRHRWAQSGGQSRGMREGGWPGGGAGGEPAGPRAPGGKAALSEAWGQVTGSPRTACDLPRSGLPLVGLACGHGASRVSWQDPCRAGGALWWPTATPPGSRGPAKRSSAELSTGVPPPSRWR